MYSAEPRVRAQGTAKRSWLLRIYRLWRAKGTAYVIDRVWLRIRGPRTYDPDWIKAHDALTSRDVELIRERIRRMQKHPLISVLLPLRNWPFEDIEAAIQSVTAQLYVNWELCVVGNASDSNASLISELAARDPRIRISMSNNEANPANARNKALAMADGEFVTVLEPSGRLAPHALYLIVEESNAVPTVGLVYSDEDKIDTQGRRGDPHFKTDWNPDLFLSDDYIGNLCAYRRSLAIEVGGYRPAFADQADYDLRLRMIERVAAQDIHHIPFLLYHDCGGGGSDHASIAASRRALEQHLARTGIVATVEPGRGGRHYRVRRALPAVPPRVSLIMPTRDRLDLIKGAVDNIVTMTDYPDYEIVIVDNQSIEPETLAYFESVRGCPRVRVLRYEKPFNYSAINNFAARQCSSPVLGLVNNDVLVINSNWLTEMVSHAIRPEVGAVGAMLYYPDDTIQHAGILVGFGGSAINCFTGLERGAPGYYFRAQLIQNYSAVTGACLLTRASVFAEVGGLNEADLAVAFNDVDYCLRLRERGYLVTWTPFAELYHLESVSRGDDMAPDKVARFRREQRYLATRWVKVLPCDPYYNPNLSIDDRLFRLAEQPRCSKPWLIELQARPVPTH